MSEAMVESDTCACGCGWKKADMPAPTKPATNERTLVSMEPMPAEYSPDHDEGWIVERWSDGTIGFRFTQQDRMFLPQNVLRRLTEAGITGNPALAILEHLRFAELVYDGLKAKYIPKGVNLLLNEVLRLAPEMADRPAGYIHGDHHDGLGDVLEAVIDANLDAAKTKKVMEVVLAENVAVSDVIAKLGFDRAGVSAEVIAQTVRKVLSAYPDEITKYKAGKKQLAGFFVGKVMKELGANAAAPAVKQEVEAQLA